MGIYINSKGEEIDTADLEEGHIQRAYDKAVREGNQDNIDALQAELDARGESNIDTTQEDTIDDGTGSDTIDQ